MSERVDAVLADIWHRGLCTENVHDFERVRAAVAELAAAANLAADWITEAGLRHPDLPNDATLSRLVAALARVGGAS